MTVAGERDGSTSVFDSSIAVCKGMELSDERPEDSDGRYTGLTAGKRGGGGRFAGSCEEDVRGGGDITPGLGDCPGDPTAPI